MIRIIMSGVLILAISTFSSGELPSLPIVKVSIEVKLSSVANRSLTSKEQDVKNRADTGVYSCERPIANALYLDGNLSFWDSLINKCIVKKNFTYSFACDLNDATIKLTDSHRKIFKVYYSACDMDYLIVSGKNSTTYLVLGEQKEAYYAHMRRFFDWTIDLLSQYNQHGPDAIDKVFGKNKEE
jgi:hypothetical protein